MNVLEWQKSQNGIQMSQDSRFKCETQMDHHNNCHQRSLLVQDKSKLLSNLQTANSCDKNGNNLLIIAPTRVLTSKQPSNNNKVSAVQNVKRLKLFGNF